jgi:hypothetical protein
MARHATDHTNGTVIAMCPHVADDPEAHLSFTVQYSDTDTAIFDELMDAWPTCTRCGAELNAVHHQEPAEVLE